jgi:omega-hydroxy-beta-dihydromenaquinone-9 sulfotransferase
MSNFSTCETTKASGPRTQTASGWRQGLSKSSGPGLILGMTLLDLARLLKENGLQFPARSWLKLAATGLISLATTPLRRVEDAVYCRRLAKQDVQNPLFIIGHWRSGTTHLHNLMSIDERFAYANFSQMMIPHTFLVGERVLSTLSALFLPPERMGVDNVAMNPHVPWEEEFALCQMTGMSPYLTWVFPRRADHYDRYVTFRDAPAAEIERWKAAFVKLLKKLAWKYNRPLILKSPPHTGRIKMILEMFPDARFVHIHRDPYVVYLSTMRLHQKCIENYALQTCNQAMLHGRVIRQYREMLDAFFEERHLIPPGQFCEVSFAELEADPLGLVRRIYDDLALPNFDDVETALTRYVDSLAGYEKNSHVPLNDDVRKEIAREWRRSFEEWKYPT